jgi:hypothetical protein
MIDAHQATVIGAYRDGELAHWEHFIEGIPSGAYTHTDPFGDDGGDDMTRKATNILYDIAYHLAYELMRERGLEV